MNIPRIIFWELTKECNLNCDYCRVLGGGDRNELSTDEALRLVSEIKDTFGNVLLILSGGEALLRKDIEEILTHARSIGLIVSVATNGTLLDERTVRLLKDSDVKRVSISLDSTDEKAHDQARGFDGAMKRTLEGISLLNKNAIPFQINFTVTRSSKDELRDIAQFSKCLGAVAVHYFVLVPVGCGRELAESEMLNAQEAEDVLRTIRDIKEEMPIEVRPTCAPQYVRFDKEGKYGGCLAGSKVFFISSGGDVYPCGYLPVKSGSVRYNSLDEIWQNSEVFNKLRSNEIKDGCSVCDFKARCKGCRARAYGLTGDYLAEDETCARNRKAAAA